MTGAAVGVAYALLAMAALSYRSAMYFLRRLWRLCDEWTQAYQYHEVPRRLGLTGAEEEEEEENPLFRKALVYVSSLPSLEDADAATVLLLSPSPSRKKTGLSLRLGHGHAACDAFLGARLAWTYRRDDDDVLVLRVRRHDRTRHVESVADELDLQRRRRGELRVFANTGGARWASAPFTNPATLDTAVAMDSGLKARVRADLESFASGRAYYRRLGLVWRRSYLLHGPPGTGKSTFASAMARFLGYDLDLSHAGPGDVRALLMRTTPRSLILVEHLHLYHGEEDDAASSVMGGVFASCCGEERVMVFTTTQGGEAEATRGGMAGRVDVRVGFKLCDFEAFKAMASSYLGLREHKLYPEVEEGFVRGGARLSPAELGGILVAHRGSPTRALRAVITKLQLQPRVSGPSSVGTKLTHRRVTSWSGPEAAVMAPAPAGGGVFAKDAPIRGELKKLYGLMKIRSRREGAGVVPLEEGDTVDGRRGGEQGSGDHGKEW
ncbi:hypothetical protein BRADI_1g77710v3 [Brachypodium distachyon]|uniref:AAA+ ATPase domain-containing protein n=1 Tax=Brachypodium distachyon TaxID=15368 RepID=A0A0Q3HMI8_BRADI|nr:hypothetical protein BRADI_1g77710v3 [Brachypodium distachyon]